MFVKLTINGLELYIFLFLLQLHQVGEAEEGHPSWHKDGGSAKVHAEKLRPNPPETAPPGTRLTSCLLVIRYFVVFTSCTY